jgi:hypothetical protein
MVDLISCITQTKLKIIFDALLVKYQWTFISLATGALIHVKLNDSIKYIFAKAEIPVLCFY